MTTHKETTQNVMFRPRRLAHGNLFVSDLERSMQFYTQVCGLTEVFREPPIMAGFLSNGSSHHDMALLQISDRTRVGRDGQTLIPKERGSRAGLNHFGWEMENEAVLVEAYHRAQESGVNIHRTADHQVSHSVYVFDPEGNLHEFYADASDDWREIWRHGNTEVLTGEWSPDSARPCTKPLYIAEPELVPESGAAIPTRQIGHGALVVSNYQELLRFYTQVAGLEIAFAPPDGSFAVLRGTLSGWDLGLFPATETRPAGLHHIGFEVRDEGELEKAEARLDEAGIAPELKLDHPSKRSIFLKDPDGVRLEFYVERSAPLSSLAETNGYDPAYLT